jgi:hypothetical protein
MPGALEDIFNFREELPDGSHADMVMPPSTNEKSKDVPDKKLEPPKETRP